MKTKELTKGTKGYVTVAVDWCSDIPGCFTLPRKRNVCRYYVHSSNAARDGRKDSTVEASSSDDEHIAPKRKSLVDSRETPALTTDRLLLFQFHLYSATFNSSLKKEFQLVGQMDKVNHN